MRRSVLMIIVALMACMTVNAETGLKDSKLRYGMYLGPIKAGEAQLITRNVTYDGKEAVRMDLIARTTSAVEKIFSLNDTITTFMKADDMTSMYFSKHCFEGDDIVLEKAEFSRLQNGKYQAKMRKDYKDGRVKERTETCDTPIYDMLSVVQFSRSIDTSSLTKGKRMTFWLVDAAEIIEECLIYQGRETVKISGKKFNCLVYKLVEPYVEKGKKKDREILNIYVNDDEARTIVEMDIKFKVGTAKTKIIL